MEHLRNLTSQIEDNPHAFGIDSIKEESEIKNEYCLLGESDSD